MVRFTEGRVLSFHVASGASLTDCAAIISAVHEDRGFHPDDAFDWLVEWFPSDDGQVREYLGPKESASHENLWRAPDGTSFVVLRGGGVLQLRAGQRTRHQLPFVVTGVAGVDSGEAYVSGIRGTGDQQRHLLVRWDGRGFRDIEAPGYVLHVAGPNPNHLYATGRDGLLAHWDGNAWRKFLPESAASVGGLTVVDPDIAYASTWSGELYELSPHGCSLIARHKYPLVDVGHCGGQIYAASFAAPGGDAGITGLLRLEGTTLVPVKLEGAPRCLDSRGGNMLITTTDRILETQDGETMKTRELYDVAGPILDAEPDE